LSFVEYHFEFGSIFKPLVVAIAFELGDLDKNFSYFDPGCLMVKKKKICNYDKRGRGPHTNLKTIIAQSLNTGMIKIMQKMKPADFFNFLLKMEADRESGIDLPNEVAPNISNLNTYNEVNYATASFGQGISFTPISIVKLWSALANDGYLVKPRIVRKIDYGDLIPEKINPVEKKKIFSAQTIRNIKELLVYRTDKSLKGKPFFNPKYSVATKSGTAQIPNPRGGYLKGQNIHAMFGFFPAYAKPKDRYLIFIYTVKPKGVRYSSQSLTKPLFEIINFMIGYYNILPDRLREL